MKIALVQIEAVPGNLEKNIEKHLHFIDQAAAHHPDLIVFPELSLTGYEPELASALATGENDARLEVFQDRSKRHQSVIAVGLPLRSSEGIHIGMLIFHPNGTKQVYRKQILHEDEKPFFIPGKDQVFIGIKGFKIAPAICYEAFQKEYLNRCVKSLAEIYLIAVSKHAEGIEQAYEFIRENSKAHALAMLLVNSVGFCDNFLSAGGSSIWSEKGMLLQQLGPSEEGLLLYEHKGIDSRKLNVIE